MPLARRTSYQLRYPGKSYQVLWSDSPAGPRQNAQGGLLTAGTLQITFSYTDIGTLA